MYEKLIVSDMTSLEKKLTDRMELSIDKLGAVFKKHIEKTFSTKEWSE